LAEQSPPSARRDYNKTLPTKKTFNGLENFIPVPLSDHGSAVCGREVIILTSVHYRGKEDKVVEET